MTKTKINFWDDAEVKEALEKRAEKENRDVSNLIRTKIKKIRGIEKW